jgi:hypothetical protein
MKRSVGWKQSNERTWLGIGAALAIRERMMAVTMKNMRVEVGVIARSSGVDKRVRMWIRSSEGSVRRDIVYVGCKNKRIVSY